MRVTFAAALALLPEDDREAAVDLAADGYVVEHLARGGTLRG